MIGYVAKDKDGEIFLYTEKHTYNTTYEAWFSGDIINVTGQFSEFNSMSYTDEPVKVEIKLERI